MLMSSHEEHKENQKENSDQSQSPVIRFKLLSYQQELISHRAQERKPSADGSETDHG